MTALAGAMALGACSDDEIVPGNPRMEVKAEDADAFFGDSIPFTINADDQAVPLSTLKARLYYGEEMVSETVIRTKESGSDYSGKIYAPFYKGTINGKATIKYVLQNINQTVTEMEREITIARPEWDYIILRDEKGTERHMNRVAGTYGYVCNDAFGSKCNAKIILPKYGENGNEMEMGWDASSSTIVLGGTSNIPYSSPGQTYDITFNTLTFEASPFVQILFAGSAMSMTGNADEYAVDVNLTKGQTIETTLGSAGFDLPNWYIDPAFMEANGDGTYKWVAMSGSYRVTAIGALSYFQFEVLKDGALATLNESDGSGALWIIGEGIGKPSAAANQVGWVTEKGLCMAPVSKGVYSVVVTAGKQIASDKINFKFFGQKGWGIELGHTSLTSSSDIIQVGDGTGGHDSGNLYLADGKSLTLGHIYKITVDCSAGATSSKLTLEDIGQEEILTQDIYVNGTKLTPIDANNYQATLSLTKGMQMSVGGISNPLEYYLDPDYLTADFKFIPESGDYRVKINTETKTATVTRMNGTQEATLGSDGHGVVWLMGNGVGSPRVDDEFGFTPGAAYAMAEVSPKVYRFSGVAGPRSDAERGQRIAIEAFSIKFFHQDGWGGEFSTGSGQSPLTIADDSVDLLKMTADGNFELKDGVTLTEGAAYEFVIDLTAGVTAGKISLRLK